MMEPKISRRTLLAGGAALFGPAASAKAKLKVAIFSKHLQFVDGEELAKTSAELGFDGIDITVRKGGHVEPERVKQDLPQAGGRDQKAGPGSAHGHHRHRGCRNALCGRRDPHGQRTGDAVLPFRRLQVRGG